MKPHTKMFDLFGKRHTYAIQGNKSSCRLLTKHNFLFSVFTTPIQKVLKTTEAGTKQTCIYQQTVVDSLSCFPQCILPWLWPAELKVHQAGVNSK